MFCEDAVTSESGCLYYVVHVYVVLNAIAAQRLSVIATKLNWISCYLHTEQFGSEEPPLTEYT